MLRVTRHLLTRAAIAAVVATASLTVVQSQAPAPPAATGAPELNLSHEKFRLDNGLTVIVHEDRKAPVVSVSIWYRVGSKNEPAGKTGFAHLFEHLMFNGSEHFDDEWFGPLQQVGATGVNGSTWFDRTNYYQTVPTPALDRVLWMESDRMGHLLGAVTQAKLDNQRSVVQNEKRQRDNQPYAKVNYRLYEGLFPPGHPYRHLTIGSMEDLDAASLEDVHTWFRTYYGPNNVVVALAGDITVPIAREKMQRFFGHIPAGPEIDALKAFVPTKEVNSHEVMHDNVPAILANRAWAVAGRNTRDRALLDLAAAVLGGGRNSRLYRDLVYDRQVASSVDLAVSPFELASIFDLSVTMVPGQNAALASEAIDRAVAEFTAKGPTAEELARVKTAINASTIRGLEQVSGKASTLAEGELYAGDPVFIRTYLDWINSATPDDVRQAAQRWLTRGWHQVDVVPAGRYTASGQGVDRKAGLPPVPANMPRLSFPAIQTGTLSNGVRVIVAERRALPLVEFSMQFDAGYAADAGGKLGVASFAMSMLDTGTTTRTALQISEEAERLGANVSAGSNLDASVVALSALKSQLEPSIALWADLVRNPVFAEQELNRLRGRWIANIAQEKAQPTSLAYRLLPPVLYGPGHAYAVPLTGSGTVDSINSIARADLVAFKNTWLRPDNASIFIVGDTTLAEITPLLERAFAGWTAPATAKPTKNVASVARPSSPRIILVDRPGSPQSFILGGQLAPGLGSDRDLAIDAMNGVLGGTFTARINMNLREDKGWSYGATSILQTARGMRPYLVYAPVQTDRAADSLAELIRELEAINSTRPVTQEERDRVIAGLTRELPGRFETANAVLGSLVTSARYGRPLDYAATLTERYEALTLADLQAAARDFVHPRSVTWLVVGDLAKIRDQIAALNIAPVEVWNDDGQPVK
jgi:zinc protease